MDSSYGVTVALWLEYLNENWETGVQFPGFAFNEAFPVHDYLSQD